MTGCGWEWPIKLGDGPVDAYPGISDRVSWVKEGSVGMVRSNVSFNAKVLFGDSFIVEDDMSSPKEVLEVQGTGSD
jgi:hypothetical protein